MIVTHVIEGNAATRLFVRWTLQRAGFTVTEAATDQHVLAASPDLLIVDPAIASLATLRRHHPAAKILVIVDARDPAELDCLVRPFTPSQLLAAVRRCLSRPDATTGRRRRLRSRRPRRV